MGVKMNNKRYAIRLGLNYEIEDIIDHCKQDKHLGFSDFMIQINEQDKAYKKLKKENEQLKEKIARQKFSKKMMKDNIKDYERAIKRLRKSHEEFDKMRLDRIRFLEKRLKKNGLSIYINDCGDLE